MDRSPQKQCPECGTPARRDAGFCARCGHTYRTQFTPPDRTRMVEAPKTTVISPGQAREGLPLETREFCVREGLEDWLCRAVEMAREFFPAAQTAKFQLMSDPEGYDEWLAIRFAVGGDLSVNDIIERYDRFTDAWLEIAPEWAEEKIRVSFNKA